MRNKPVIKIQKKPSIIGLILTNSLSSFQNSCAINWSDFHKMTITVIKTTFQKLKPRLIYYRDYSMFSNDKCREPLSQISMENMGRGFSWSTSRFCSSAYIIQYLFNFETNLFLFLVMKETEFTSYPDNSTLLKT